MGVDVIKVESPGQGDYLRDMLGQIVPHHSPAHLQVNKNKRSMTLDLRREEGRDVFWDLLRTADVFVDGFLAGACDALGIGYERQREIKPDIVYCHYSGFGATGPYARIPTHGQMMNALAASVPLETGGDGLVREQASTEPMKGTTIGGDGTAAGAVHAALHVVAALVRRAGTGQGCYLDAAGSDGVVAQGWIGATYALNNDRITDRTGLRQPGDVEAERAPSTTSTRPPTDGTCCSAPSSTSSGSGSGESVDRPDLIGGNDVGDSPVDFAHRDEPLRRELQAIFSMAQSGRVGRNFAGTTVLPLGPAHQRVAELRDDPQISARQIIVEGEHPAAGAFTYVGEPVIVDGTPYRLRRPAPSLGEHTDELLGELGRTAEDIASLRAKGVIGA